MRKLTLLLLLALSTQLCVAGHVIGYDMCLLNIKDNNGASTNQYKIRLNFYRDVVGPGIPASFTCTIVRKDNHTAVQNITLSKVNTQTFLTYDSENCPPAHAQLRHELGIYESPAFSGTNFSVAQGYYIYCKNSARNEGIKNVLGQSSNYFMLMTMDFPRLSTGATMYNSSPVFNKKALNFYSLGKSQTINMQVVDADGDSLVYSLVKPLNDGTTQPFSEIPFADGYNLNFNIMDGAPDININPITGIVNFTPNQLGKYLIAIKVEEYKKIAGVPTKIGEVRREMQIEIVHTPELPPYIQQSQSNAIHLTDTIKLSEVYTVNFSAYDQPTDSVFMYILPNITPGENILDPNNYEAKWGEVGFLLSGLDALNLVLVGQGIVQGQFKWTPKCQHVRDKPYEFKIVARDKTCPTSFTDTMYVKLYVTKKDNNPPMFTYPVLAKKNENKIIRYNLAKDEVLSFTGNTAIKTLDNDSLNVVNIVMYPDVNNGADFNNSIYFSSSPNLVTSSANFSITAYCKFNRPEPYKVYLLAIDNDCKKPDTTILTIEIYIKENVLSIPSICAVTVDFSNSFNIIYWNDIQNVDLNYYTIYRENLNSGVFDSIGRVEKAAILKFNDYNVNLDKPLRYKIAASTYCFNRTPLSSTHSNVLLKAQKLNDTLCLISWNSLVGAIPSTQNLYRSINMGTYEKIASLPITSTSYIDTTKIIGIAEYKLEILRDDYCYTISPTNNFAVYSNSVKVQVNSTLNENSLSFKLFPNPVNENLTIQIDSYEQAKYQIIDMLGKEIMNGNFQYETLINSSTFLPGLYFIKVSTESNTSTQKIIKR